MAVSAEEMQAELIAEERYHEDWISNTERIFSTLSLDIAGVARKTALIRDKGDKLSKHLQQLKNLERGKIKCVLDCLSECVAGLEDYRQTQIDRFEAKVVKPLLDYENNCRKAREELKSFHTDRNHLIEQQKVLDRVRIRDGSNRRRIAQLQSDLEKAKFKYSQTSDAVENFMIGFERRRIHDLKFIVSEYIQANMLFHAKALEINTHAYQSLTSINDEEALQEFLAGLHCRKRGRMDLELPSHPQLPLTRTNSNPSIDSHE